VAWHREDLGGGQALAEQIVRADRRDGDRRAGLPGDTGGVGHMVEVRMTHEDVIGPGHLGRAEAERAVARWPVVEVVKQDDLVPESQLKRGRAKPPDGHHVAVGMRGAAEGRRTPVVAGKLIRHFGLLSVGTPFRDSH
jgi:hypothetical protein